jgi:hypothetical protein
MLYIEEHVLNFFFFPPRLQAMFPSELNIMDIEEEVIALHMYILSLNER